MKRRMGTPRGIQPEGERPADIRPSRPSGKGPVIVDERGYSPTEAMPPAEPACPCMPKELRQPNIFVRIWKKFITVPSENWYPTCEQWLRFQGAMRKYPKYGDLMPDGTWSERRAYIREVLEIIDELDEEQTEKKGNSAKPWWDTNG